MVERADRRLTRLAQLPTGQAFPFPITMWRTGDVLWLALEAEHYNILQRQLRRRFLQMPIMVMTLVNGARPGYLVPAEAYGKGIYQESVAMLAPGSLEKLIDALEAEIQSWL